MKTLYILPESNGESNAVQELLTRAGIRYIEVASLHELWPHLVENIDVVARIPSGALTVLVRHMSTLLGEEPVRVDAAPGSKYSHEFSLMTSSLTGELWDTLEGRFSKSGLLSHSPSDVEERSPLTPQGHKTEENAKLARSRARVQPRREGQKEEAASSHIDLNDLDEGADSIDALID